MKRGVRPIVLVVVAAFFQSLSDVTASQRVWSNAAADFNATPSWDGPIAGNVGAFAAAPAIQPNVTSSLSIVGLFFKGVSGYDVTGNALIVTGQYVDASLGENANANAAAIASTNTSGVNTVDTALVLASSTGTSTFFQNGGGELLVNGSISGNGVGLQISSGSSFGRVRLTGNNSYTGSTSIVLGATLEVPNIGNAGAVSALGTSGVINLGGSGTGGQNHGGTIRYTGVGETTNKVINLANTQDFAIIDQSGTGHLKFTGTNTSTGSGFAARFLVLQGSTSGTGEIAGAIVDGNQGPSGLIKNGSGSWTISAHNTYSFFTGVNEGTLIAAADGALGLGNVSLTATGAVLTLQLGVTNNYIADTATLGLVAGSILNLNFSGSGDKIANLTIDGVLQPGGIYNSFTNPGLITGTGSIINTASTVPEPMSCVLAAFGAGVCAWHFRRGQSDRRKT